MSAVAAVVAGFLAYAATRQAREAAREAAVAAGRANDAAERANEVAERVAAIEVHRRKDELRPRFQISCELHPSSDRHLLIRAQLIGPPGLTEIADVKLSIRANQKSAGEEYKYHPHTWSLYRFAGSSHELRASVHASIFTLNRGVALGGEFEAELEKSISPVPVDPNGISRPWSDSAWSAWVGDRMQFYLLAEHLVYGAWLIPFEFRTVEVPFSDKLTS